MSVTIRSTACCRNRVNRVSPCGRRVSERRRGRGGAASGRRSAHAELAPRRAAGMRRSRLPGIPPNPLEPPFRDTAEPAEARFPAYRQHPPERTSPGIPQRPPERSSPADRQHAPERPSPGTPQRASKTSPRRTVSPRRSWFPGGRPARAGTAPRRRVCARRSCSPGGWSACRNHSPANGLHVPEPLPRRTVSARRNRPGPPPSAPHPRSPRPPAARRAPLRPARPRPPRTGRPGGPRSAR